MSDLYSPIFLIPWIIAYYLWILVLPILVAQLLVYMLIKHFGWKLKKKQKWLWIILLASIWITYPWFSIVEDIEGRVVNVAGQPIEGVLVTALWEYQSIIRVTNFFSSSGSHVAQARESVSDKEGRFHIHGFTYFSSLFFNRKLEPEQPKVGFFHEGLRVDYKLSKFRKNKTFSDSGIVRKSRWNGLDVVMVVLDGGSQRSRADGVPGGVVTDVLEDNGCLWANIPNAITIRFKATNNSVWFSEDTVKFGQYDPKSMKKCGVDISFFEGLDEWNIRTVQ